MALFWVTAKARGLTVTQRRLADGMLLAKLTLDGVRLDASAMLASTAVADGIFQQAYAEALILASVELLGVMERALAITFDYLSTRVQFGKPIGSFQALQHRSVDLFIQKELAAAAIDEGLVAVEHGMTGRALSGLASRIKARASDAALSIGRDAIQLHGAVGFTDEHDIGLYLKRAMVLSSWLGNGAAHRRRYAALQATANRS
jgi:alkylation response protein AidB-like acyl-CoA dehydrogenase